MKAKGKKKQTGPETKVAGEKATDRGRKKAEKILVQTRINEILNIRLDGAEFHDVREYARENNWNLSDGQLRRYMAATDEVILASVEKDRPKLVARHLLQRRRLYAQAVEVGDLRLALSSARDEAELQGLYPATKHQHTGPDGGAIEHVHTLTPEQRRVELLGIVAAIRDRGRAGENPTPADGGSQAADMDAPPRPPGSGV